MRQREERSTGPAGITTSSHIVAPRTAGGPGPLWNPLWATFPHFVGTGIASIALHGWEDSGSESPGCPRG